MNYEKLKLQECSNIIQNKNRGVLSLGGYSAPYQELVFDDTDCFCGCLNIYFKTCDCGTLMKYLKANNSASLLISRKCNNYIETVIIMLPACSRELFIAKPRVSHGALVANNMFLFFYFHKSTFFKFRIGPFYIPFAGHDNRITPDNPFVGCQ